MKLKEIVEGKAKILIPDPSEYTKEGKFDPSWAPVFYNPKMVFNRDISVIVVSILKPKVVVDALSATGIRGVRYFLESWRSEELIFNDKNTEAISLIKQNLKLNGIDDNVTKVYNRDANSLLYEIKADYVDIDPFGTPAPFILSSINATVKKGVVAITATDLSALTGSSVLSARRKYDVINSKLSSSKELGIRVLIGKVIREASIVEKAVYPLFSFYNDYYYRLFLRVDKGAKKADKAIQTLKYFGECDKCGFQQFLDERCNKMKCPRCGGEMTVIGPLYYGPINDKEFVQTIGSSMKKFEYVNTFSKLEKFISVIKDECIYDSVYYKLDKIASKNKIKNIPQINKILECLGDGTRTHFDPVGIKTNKEYEEVINCMKKLSG